MWENFNLWHVLWSVILGAGFGWLAGRAFPRLGLRLWGYVAVGVIGALALGVIGPVAGGLFLGFCLFVGPYIGGCPWDSLFTASLTAVLSLAFVIIFARRR